MMWAEVARTASGSVGDSSERWRWASRGGTAPRPRPSRPPQPGGDGSPWPRGARPANRRGDARRTSSCGRSCCRRPAARSGTTTTTTSRPATRTSSGGADDGGDAGDEPRHRRRPLPCRRPFPCRFGARDVRPREHTLLRRTRRRDTLVRKNTKSPLPRWVRRRAQWRKSFSTKPKRTHYRVNSIRRRLPRVFAVHFVKKKKNLHHPKPG